MELDVSLVLRGSISEVLWWVTSVTSWRADRDPDGHWLPKQVSLSYAVDDNTDWLWASRPITLTCGTIVATMNLHKLDVVCMRVFRFPTRLSKVPLSGLLGAQQQLSFTWARKHATRVSSLQLGLLITMEASGLRYTPFQVGCPEQKIQS